MMALLTSLLPATTGNPRGCHGSLAQRNIPGLLFPWNRYRPLLCLRRKTQYGKIASRIDECHLNTSFSQAIQRSIDGHTFSNPAKVQANTLREGYTALVCI